MFQVRCERDCFFLPTRQTNQRANAESSKTRRITALGAIQSKIEIAFRPGGVHFGIHATIVGLLINDKALRAGLDNLHIIHCLHWADLDRNRRKLGGKRADALSKIIAAHKFWMLARDQKDLAKSLTREMPRFRDNLINIERDAKDRIIARETAIATIVDALVREIQRREKAHCSSKILQCQ